MARGAGIDIERLVEDLAAKQKRVRFAAVDALQAITKKGVTAAMGSYLLRAAGRSFPPQRYDFQSTQVDLIRAAATRPVASYVPIVRAIFPNLVAPASPGLSDARGVALDLLASIEHVSAARAFVELFEESLAEGPVPRVGLRGLHDEPRHPKVFFPRLLELAERHDSLAFDVYALALAYAQKGVLSPAALAPHARYPIEAYARLGALPGAGIGAGLGRAWLWDEAYAPTRINAALLLDVLGHVGSRTVDSILRNAVKSADPRLALFAATSALRRGARVSSTDLARIAEDPSTRGLLFDALVRDGHAARFPERWKTQEALAEADMVRWLTFPSELGRAPDEIELMQIVEADLDAPPTPFRWYVFRFRTHSPHWSATDGWLAGISGPFKCSDAPTTTSWGNTFSTFAPWDSKTPEEHVEEVHALVRGWREGAYR